MDKHISSSINRRLLQNFNARTTDVCAKETLIDSRVFADPAIAEIERSRLFYGTPQPVAFSSEIPEPGCYLALRLLDLPILLARNEQGELSAFINSCMHRGAQVAHGSGKSNSLVCSFHGWTYSHDGTLKGRPEDAMFATSTEDCALPRLPVTEKHGIVVVGPSSDIEQQSVDSALEEIGLELNGFQFSQYKLIERKHFDVAANWKLVNDLSLESYHFRTLHRESVAQILASNAVVDTFGRHSRWAFPLKSIARLAALEESEWPDKVEGSVTYTLYPGVMLLVNQSGAQMIRAEPGKTPDSAVVTYVGMCTAESNFDEARAAFEFGGEVFGREDLPVAEQCQRGLQARGGQYILGANEPLLHFWHRQWDYRKLG